MNSLVSLIFRKTEQTNRCCVVGFELPCCTDWNRQTALAAHHDVARAVADVAFYFPR